MRLLRVWLHRLTGRETIEKFFETEDPTTRAILFRDRWEGWWWWIFTRVLLSRKTMTLLFDKAFFQYLDRSFSFGKHFAARVKHALTELPVKENYFLADILRGTYYSESHLPFYLRRQNFETIKCRLDRVEITCDNCEHFFTTLPDESISKFNFTNIFEWMSPDVFENLLRQTVRVATHGAILTYRNLLVFRERPIGLAKEIHPLKETAKSLHHQDLSFIYSNYVVEQIVKDGTP